MKFKIEALENVLPPKQQLVKRFHQQEEHLQERMKEPIDALVQAEPFPSWETWVGDLDVQLTNRLKNRPADEIRRMRRQYFAELAFLLDIQDQLQQFVQMETQKISAILFSFLHLVPLIGRLDISSRDRECKECGSINASREQQKTAVPIKYQIFDAALEEIEAKLRTVRSVMQKVARRFFDGYVPLLTLAAEPLDLLQKQVDGLSVQLRPHFMDASSKKTIEGSSSEIEAEALDMVERMKEKAEMAMYSALGELDMVRTLAGKHLKKDQQALQTDIEQLRKQLLLTQKKH